MAISLDLKSAPATESVATRRQRAGRGELAVAGLIFCVGTWVGVRAVQTFRTAGGAQYFYQSDFGPAVMLACGRGFQDPDSRSAPALAAFLAQQSDTLECTQVPQGIPTSPMNAFQRSSRYLEGAVGLAWKVTGLSWSRLAVLPGLLFGAVAALTYSLLRLAMSRTIALLALLAGVTSTPNFMQVPQLRDYAKGPFLLATLLIMGLIVVGAADCRRLIALSLLAGALIGLGLGFRTDLAVALVPFTITLACLVPPAASVRTRVAAIAVFLMSFVVLALPILLGFSKGGNNGHDAMLGLVADFDGPLRIEPSVYEFGGPYIDSFAASTINSYGIRVEGRSGAVDAASTDYERVAAAYLLQIAASFPADVVTRIAAAVRTMPKYFLDSSLYPPVQLQSARVRGLYPLRARIFWRLGQIALLAGAVATVLVSAVNPRAAWLIVLILVGFAGASAIQFHERHFYYLQFLPWCAFGLLAQTAIDGPRLLKTVTSDQFKQAARFGLMVALSAGFAIGLSRAYQQRRAAQLFERYESALRTPLQMRARPAGEGRILLAAPEWLQPLPSGIRQIETRFVAVRFRDDVCGPGNLPLTIRYDGRQRAADLSEPITVRLRASALGPTTLFVAAYDWANESIRFRGIEVPAGREHCVADLSSVQGLERTPLLLTTALSADWREERLYQRLH